MNAVTRLITAAGLCITPLAVGAPVFSPAPGGPSGLEPDRIYMAGPGSPTPIGGGPGPGLGMPGDDLDAVSSGIPDEEWVFCWAVAPGSVGTRTARPRGPLPPFDLNNQAANNQQTGDGFLTTEAWDKFGAVPSLGLGLFTNALAINQGGDYFTTLGLLPDVDPNVSVPGGTPLDDVNAEMNPIDADDPVPAIYFSVSGNSPSLGALPPSPIPSGADIFFDPDPNAGGDETLFVAGQQLGLIIMPDPAMRDDIDGLSVHETIPDGQFDPFAGEFVIFSLRPDSPTLVNLGAGPADLLIFDADGLRVLAQGADMGLADADDVNALRAMPLIGPDVASTFEAVFALPECPGDANGDLIVDLQDLNLVLANFGEGPKGDVNEDGIVDLADLNLVLANFSAECPDPE